MFLKMVLKKMPESDLEKSGRLNGAGLKGRREIWRLNGAGLKGRREIWRFRGAIQWFFGNIHLIAAALEEKIR